MSYLDVLDENIVRAEMYLRKAEYAREQGWRASYEVCMDSVAATLKCTRFCVECAKAKLKAGKKLSCTGGCVKGWSYNDFNKSNKKLWYVRHWTRKHDYRY
jgi:hypothetical protein